MLVLKTVTFLYRKREDRILAALNAGQPEAWSCWLTRRLALAMLERAAELLARTSALAQVAPADVRSELVAFERDAAMVNTAKGLSPTPGDVLKSSWTAAELLERITISSRRGNFRVELQGESGGGMASGIARDDLQRILQMLQTEVAKADWLSPSATSATPASKETWPKPARH